MSDERYDEINAFRLEYDDLPDGAFFAFAEERGISAEDWAEWTTEHEKRIALAAASK